MNNSSWIREFCKKPKYVWGGYEPDTTGWIISDPVQATKAIFADTLNYGSCLVLYPEKFLTPELTSQFEKLSLTCRVRFSTLERFNSSDSFDCVYIFRGARNNWPHELENTALFPLIKVIYSSPPNHCPPHTWILTGTTLKNYVTPTT